MSAGKVDGVDVEVGAVPQKRASQLTPAAATVGANWKQQRRGSQANVQHFVKQESEDSTIRECYTSENMVVEILREPEVRGHKEASIKSQAIPLYIWCFGTVLAALFFTLITNSTQCWDYFNVVSGTHLNPLLKKNLAYQLFTQEDYAQLQIFDNNDARKKNATERMIYNKVTHQVEMDKFIADGYLNSISWVLGDGSITEDYDMTALPAAAQTQYAGYAADPATFEAAVAAYAVSVNTACTNFAAANPGMSCVNFGDRMIDQIAFPQDQGFWASFGLDLKVESEALEYMGWNSTVYDFANRLALSNVENIRQGRASFGVDPNTANVFEPQGKSRDAGGYSIAAYGLGVDTMERLSLTHEFTQWYYLDVIISRASGTRMVEWMGYQPLMGTTNMFRNLIWVVLVHDYPGFGMSTWRWFLWYSLYWFNETILKTLGWMAAPAELHGDALFAASSNTYLCIPIGSIVTFLVLWFRGFNDLQPKERRAKRRLVWMFWRTYNLRWLVQWMLWEAFARQYSLVMWDDLIALGRATFGDQMVIRAFYEAFVAAVFFSIYIPFAWMLLAHTICICMVIREIMFDREERDILWRERIMVTMDNVMDLCRFLFARSILFRMSSFWMFILLQLKDESYQLLHFGFRYYESSQVLAIKALHPDGKKKIETNGHWKTCLKVLELWTRFGGILRRLAVMWEEEVDWRATVADMAENLPVTNVRPARMQFCNVRFNVRNLPEKFNLIDGLKTIEEREAEGKELVKASKQKLNFEDVLERAGPSAGVAAFEGLLFNQFHNAKVIKEMDEMKKQDRPKISAEQVEEGGKSSGALFYKNAKYGCEAEIAKAGMQDVIHCGEAGSACFALNRLGAVSVQPDGKTKFRVYVPSYGNIVLGGKRAPIDPDEMIMLQGLLAMFQCRMFNRYQVRMAARITQGWLFIILRTAADYTQAQFRLSHEGPADAEMGSKVLQAGMLFIILDVIEYFYITYYVHLRHSKVPCDVADYFNLLINGWFMQLMLSVINLMFYEQVYRQQSTYSNFAHIAMWKEMERQKIHNVRAPGNAELFFGEGDNKAQTLSTGSWFRDNSVFQHDRVKACHDPYVTGVA